MSRRKHVIGSVLFKEIDCRPVARFEPAWDALGHTVLCAFARLRELETAPRINGGKAGTKQVRDRLEARQRAWKLLDEWAEGRRHEGRELGEGSIAPMQMATNACGRNRNKPQP